MAFESIAVEAFSVQEGGRRDEDEDRIFANEEGWWFTVIRGAYQLLASLAHISLSLSFLCFFLSALSFTVNCAIEFTLHMISPSSTASAPRNNFYSFCLFILLMFTLFNASIMLSLFWDVVRAAIYKHSRRFTSIRIFIFLAALVSSGIWAGVTRTASTGFVRFLSDALVVTWVLAFSLCVLGSLFLLYRVYTKPFIFNLARCLEVCSFLWIFTLLSSILSPVAFKLVDASTGAICFAFFYPFISGIFAIYFLAFRGFREDIKSFVINPRILLVTGVTYFAIIILASNARVTCGSDCQLGFASESSLRLMGRRLEANGSHLSGYPICDKKWSKLQLGITDLAFLADLAYKISKNKTSAMIRVNTYFEERSVSWDLVHMSTKKPLFFHLRDRKGDVNVVGIRGTSDSRDWFENAKVWNEIATFQMISVALPVQHLPLDFISFFVGHSAFLDCTLNHASFNYYFKAIEAYVNKIRVTNTTKGQEVFLVGHSLGGGLAKLVGCRNKLPAISISSPGEVYNHVKFDYSLDDVHKYTTSVIADNDLVTWIDKHGGLVQYVECDTSSFLSCHSIRNTYCELKRQCDLITPIDCPSM